MSEETEPPPSRIQVALGVATLVFLLAATFVPLMQRVLLTNREGPLANRFGLDYQRPSYCPPVIVDFHRQMVADRHFDSGDLNCADFRDARLKRVTFDGVNLISADFDGAVLSDVTFVNGEFIASFHDAQLHGVVFRNALLGAYSLADAEFGDVKFEHVNCPLPDYVSDSDPCTYWKRYEGDAI